MKQPRDEIVNTKTTLRYGPTIDEMRLSRLSHPRATIVAMILLAAVFLLFGLVAGATADVSYAPPPADIGAKVSAVGRWVLTSVGLAA